MPEHRKRRRRSSPGLGESITDVLLKDAQVGDDPTTALISDLHSDVLRLARHLRAPTICQTSVVLAGKTIAQSSEAKSEDGSPMPRFERKNLSTMIDPVEYTRHLGLGSGLIYLSSSTRTQLVAKMSTNDLFIAEVLDLSKKLKQIYDSALLESESDTMMRWVVNTFLGSLLAVGSSDDNPNTLNNHSILIVPTMLVHSDLEPEVSVEKYNSDTGILLDDYKIEYCVFQSSNTSQDRAFAGRITMMDTVKTSSRHTGAFMFVEVGAGGDVDTHSVTCHQAAMKAIVLGQIMKQRQVRFCVCNLRKWQFLCVQVSSDEGADERDWTIYGGTAYESNGAGWGDVGTLTEMLIHLKEWVVPTEPVEMTVFRRRAGGI